MNTSEQAADGARLDGRRHHPKREQRWGTAVVEFALVAPLMILLTLGMMEIGRVVMVKQLLVNASREGARRAILPDATHAEVVNQVTEELRAATVNGVTVSLSGTNQTPLSDLSAIAVGEPITVSVSIPASDVSWIPNPIFTINTQLEASTTMRKESF